MGEELKKTTS